MDSSTHHASTGHMGTDEAELTRSRAEMVESQIRRRGVSDPRVLDAMRAVPRHEFVPPRLRAHAYADQALPIESDQTISQPYIVALMAEAAALAPHHRVLEVGTGSGYSAAVLSLLCAEVYSIERHASLAESAASTLARLGYDNVHVSRGDGSQGLAEHAPYDAIVVTAAARRFPHTLVEQLAAPGHLVCPVDEPGTDVQRLLRVVRTNDGLLHSDSLGGVRFVPLVPEMQ